VAAAGKRSRKVSPSWGVFRLMASPPEASRPEAPARSSSGRRRWRGFGLDPFPHTGQPVPPLVLLQTANFAFGTVTGAGWSGGFVAAGMPFRGDRWEPFKK
jgi:hypothetical protein